VFCELLLHSCGSSSVLVLCVTIRSFQSESGANSVGPEGGEVLNGQLLAQKGGGVELDGHACVRVRVRVRVRACVVSPTPSARERERGREPARVP